eukprot:3799850-Ditylum_brightwellii.AAC.1
MANNKISIGCPAVICRDTGLVSMRREEHPLNPIGIQQMEEEFGQYQTLQLIPKQNYLHKRTSAMSSIETNIVELGTIFNKLAVMVGEHHEMVEWLEDNVEDANQN